MLNGLMTTELSESEYTLSVFPSRCLKMRLEESGCEKCLAECPSTAIILDPELSINKERCSTCMRCSAVCPTEALTSSEIKFGLILNKLKKAQQPVLGCERFPQMPAHCKTQCLGWISEEHLLAFLCFLPEVQLNMSACASCVNSFTVEQVRSEVAAVSEKIGIDLSAKIRIVEYEDDLEFEAVALDRRGFFNAFKKIVAQEVVAIMDSNSNEEEASDYGQKMLPEKRALLNHILLQTSGEMREEILHSYFYDIAIDATCDGCSDCVAICPTEALKTDIDSEFDHIILDALQCNGCGLCEEFCPLAAIRIKKGVLKNSEPL